MLSTVFTYRIVASVLFLLFPFDWGTKFFLSSFAYGIMKILLNYCTTEIAIETNLGSGISPVNKFIKSEITFSPFAVWIPHLIWVANILGLPTPIFFGPEIIARLGLQSRDGIHKIISTLREYHPPVYYVTRVAGTRPATEIVPELLVANIDREICEIQKQILSYSVLCRVGDNNDETDHYYKLLEKAIR